MWYPKMKMVPPKMKMGYPKMKMAPLKMKMRGVFSVTAQQPPHPPKRKPSAKHRGLDYAKTLFFC